MDPLDRVQREELLRGAVLAGNENAWRTWYDETYDDLHRYVRWRCGGQKDWADEIVQDTWLTAVRRMRRFDPRKGSFPGLVAGRRRQLAAERPSQAAEIAKVPAIGRRPDQRNRAGRFAVEDRQRQEEVAAALDALSEREEAVLRAKYLEGLSVAEIAAVRRRNAKSRRIAVEPCAAGVS